MSFRKSLFATASLILPLIALGDGPSSGDEWFTPSRFTVRSSMVPRLDSAVTLFTAKNGDLRIESSGVAEGKNYSGVILLISGNYMLAKDVELSPGAEIDAIDAPVLQAQTAMKLLARALPGGPNSVTDAVKINISEPNDPIEIATQSASGGYPAPWRLTGSVTRESARSVSYSLSFTFAGAPQSLSIVGAWDQAVPIVLADSMSVKGWRAFLLGPYQSNRNGTTILDYGAREIPGGFSTIGDVRRYALRKAGDA